MTTTYREHTHLIVKCSCGETIRVCKCSGPKIETVREHPACEMPRLGR